MNLEKELKSIKSVDTQKHEDTVSEVKLILEGDHQEDLRIMRSMASNSTLVRAEESLGRKLQLEKFEQEYGEIYKIDQIRNLCIKYKLRFLNSKKYRGTLPMETVSKLKQFAKDTVTGIDEQTLSTKFYIIAPAEEFEMTHLSQRAENERKRREKDPVLFYKIDDEHYRLIHKWGDDFSPIRRLAGIYWQNEITNIVINMIATWGLFLTLAIYTIATWGTHLTPEHKGEMCWICVGKFFGLLASLIVSIVISAAQGDRSEYWFSNKNWNQATKMTR